MSGEVAAVLQGVGATGLLRASEGYAPTSVFGGITRTLEMDREAMATSFRTIFEDIKSGGFARRFQEEAKTGYPMLELARAMIRGASPITDAEERVRHLGESREPKPGSGRSVDAEIVP